MPKGRTTVLRESLKKGIQNAPQWASPNIKEGFENGNNH